jgi:hypothetical protein
LRVDAELIGTGGNFMRGREPVKDDWVPLEFPSPEIEEQLAEWFASRRGDVGFCFLCGRTIPTEDDMIPDTNTHNCPEGRALEARIQREGREAIDYHPDLALPGQCVDHVARVGIGGLSGEPVVLGVS